MAKTDEAVHFGKLTEPEGWAYRVKGEDRLYTSQLDCEACGACSADPEVVMCTIDPKMPLMARCRGCGRWLMLHG